MYRTSQATSASVCATMSKMKIVVATNWPKWFSKFQQFYRILVYFFEISNLGRNFWHFSDQKFLTDWDSARALAQTNTRVQRHKGYGFLWASATDKPSLSHRCPGSAFHKWLSTQPAPARAGLVIVRNLTSCFVKIWGWDGKLFHWRLSGIIWALGLGSKYMRCWPPKTHRH